MCFTKAGVRLAAPPSGGMRWFPLLMSVGVCFISSYILSLSLSPPVLCVFTVVLLFYLVLPLSPWSRRPPRKNLAYSKAKILEFNARI